MTVKTLQLTLHASQLRNVAGLGKGTSDPFAIVTLLPTGPGETPRVLGKTEVIKNTLSPNWTTSFLFDHELGTQRHIIVSVVDEVRKSTDKTMGYAVFEVGDILGRKGAVKAKKIKKGGILYVRLRTAAPGSAGTLALGLRGIQLKNMEGMFKKKDSNPFYEICRTYDWPGRTAWRPVYRSNHVKNDSNPKWEPAMIDVDALCDGDKGKKLQVAIFDYKCSGKHVPMWAFETSVNELVEASGTRTFTPKKWLKSHYGAIAVDECKIMGAEDETARACTAAEPPAVPSPVPVQECVPVPPSSVFFDFISGNCELSMCVAIDFTGSNGDPCEPGTLHHFSQNGQMNSYEKAITGVVNMLEKYNLNQMFPVWGFGAKYGGEVRHCFQVGQEKEVHGVKGILDAYKLVFKTQLIMSGPTIFTEVILLAAAEATSRQEANPLSRTILLLLTDGAVSDVQATKNTLAQISNVPISIVIVGIGDADFSAMQFLDDFERQNRMNRATAQFVKFNEHQYDKTS